MRHRITLGLTLVSLMLAASGLAAAGGNHWKSPMGAWTIQFEPDEGSPGDPNTTLQQLQFGGTITGAAWTDPWTNTGGHWTKTNRNRYLSTLYIMVPDFGGYLKVIQEFWMVDKDVMKGREEAWFVPGQDPLGEQLPGDPLWVGSLFFRRLKAEAKQIP